MIKFYLKNNSVLSYSLEEKCVVSLCINNEEMIYGKLPFFTVKLRNNEGHYKFLNAEQMSFVSYENEVAKYESNLCDVDLIFNNYNDELKVRVNVYNKTDLLIEQVELFSFGLLNKLLDEENGKGEILIPYNEGVRVTNLERRLKSPFGYIEPEYPSLGKYFIFPNMISSQFISYIANQNGIYIGLHDKDRTTKHIDFKEEDGLLKFVLRTFTNIDYGQDFIMDYDYVLKTFNGDMFDAFDIYRDWFKNNLPKNAIKIKYNDSLPSWYHESPLIVTYPVRGKNDGDKEMLYNDSFFPYNNALEELKNISKTIENKVLTLLMHYEGTAPWAPPYSFPPLGGIEMFEDFVNRCHNNNLLVGLYTSGLGWTNISYRAVYDRSEQFEKDNLKDIICVNTDGYMKSTIVDNIRLGYDLCPQCDTSKNLVITETNKLFSSGVDYVQVLDQNHGGCSYFCYSSNHGHVPAPGKWQIEETYKILENIDKKGGLIGCESASSEPFIGQLLLSDNRYILNYYIGMPVPMYAYIYHEYVNNFMGNQICMALDPTEYSYPFRLAYSFICGDMFTIVLNNNYEIVDAWCLDRVCDKNVVLSFIKTLSHYRNSYKEFLHYGEMVKPLDFKCRNKEFVHEDRTILTTDAVLTSAFRYEDQTAQFLVNFTLENQTVEFEEEVDVYLNSSSNQTHKNKTIKIKPLSVVVIRR